MLAEENKTIIRRFIDAYNKRNLEVFDELVDPDYIDHQHGQQGREPFKQLFTMAFSGFPDWHEAIEDIIAEGDKVWVRVKATGTHTGEWMGLAPTAKKVTTEMVDIFRIENGKLVEYRDVNNNLDFLKKLGLIEYTEQGKQFFPQE